MPQFERPGSAVETGALKSVALFPLPNTRILHRLPKFRPSFGAGRHIGRRPVFGWAKPKSTILPFNLIAFLALAAEDGKG